MMTVNQDGGECGDITWNENITKMLKEDMMLENTPFNNSGTPLSDTENNPI
jgi:hypothetical protein